jgi:hypothetical protein
MRAVDAGRGNLQPIGLFDQVFDVENGGERLRGELAFVDADETVRPLDHDLQRAAVLRRNLDAHETQAEIGQHLFRNMGDARGDAGLARQTRLVERRQRIGAGGCFGSGFVALGHRPFG